MIIRKHKAFTLIELLIVIVIIGILATALIPRITGMQTKARYARVEKDFYDFKAFVLMAQNNTNKTLIDITGTNCTRCACYTSNGIDLRSLWPNDTCRTTLASSLRKIEAAAQVESGSLSFLERDPRGSPYLLDENEQEWWTWDCREHKLSTAWPDWLFKHEWLWYNLQSTDDKSDTARGINCANPY